MQKLQVPNQRILQVQYKQKYLTNLIHSAYMILIQYNCICIMGSNNHGKFLWFVSIHKYQYASILLSGFSISIGEEKFSTFFKITVQKNKVRLFLMLSNDLTPSSQGLSILNFKLFTSCLYFLHFFIEFFIFSSFLCLWMSLNDI